MWRWLDKISEFAASNTHVIRAAWPAFVAWCLIALVVSWWGLGQIYGLQISNAASTITVLNSRLAAVESELREAKGQPSTAAARDPDTLYQLGEAVAHVQGAAIDRGARIVEFTKIIGTGDFAPGSDAEFRDLHLAMCQPTNVAVEKAGGVVTSQIYFSSKCPILGARP